MIFCGILLLAMMMTAPVRRVGRHACDAVVRAGVSAVGKQYIHAFGVLLNEYASVRMCVRGRCLYDGILGAD